MSAHEPRFLELLPAYALGILDPDEKIAINAHLASGCAECDAQLNAWRRDVAELGLAAEPVTPSAALRSRILSSVKGEIGAAVPVSQPVRRPAVLLRRAFPWAALLAVALWSGVRQMNLNEDLERAGAEREHAFERAAALSRQLAEARGEVGRMARVLSVISSPRVESIRLAGLGPTPGAAGRTYVNREAGRAMFYAFDLPALTSEQTYELWFITASGPVPAGTFAPNAQGTARVEVEHIAAGAPIVAWAVTVEPRGGVPKPTGAMVLKG